MTDQILMCPPDYFGIEYEINPWMHVEIDADRDLAKKQWNNLYNILSKEVKADIKLIEPRPGVPDMVFTANAAVIYKKKAIISRFRFDQRKPEEKYFGEWFEQNGYEVIWLPEDMAFEGAGDALFLGDTLYSGYVPRTDITSHAYISELLNVRVISLELTDNRFYHLDTCFCPLTDGYLMYFPGAFDEYANKVIENNVDPEKRIAVTDEEAMKFSCNAVNVGKSVIMNITTDRSKNELKRKGFVPYETDLSEFMKSGGSAKCLTIKL